ncbi:MAG TPA: regulatory protein RecX [Steroidobacteraceae bacterium]
MPSAVDPTDPQAARQFAVSLIARRDYCSGELRSKLKGRGFDSEIIEALIGALQREKVLDDQRFVEHFVAYHSGRGQGPARISRDLKGLGLPGELIERWIDAGPDWVARAREVRQKKFGRPLPQAYAEKAKQARFLQYRGFTGAQIRQALGTDIDLDDDA